MQECEIAPDHCSSTGCVSMSVCVCVSPLLQPVGRLEKHLSYFLSQPDLGAKHYISNNPTKSHAIKRYLGSETSAYFRKQNGLTDIFQGK